MARRKNDLEAESAPDKEAREALLRLNDENALLRAALAEARARLGEAEESAGRDPLTALMDPRQFARELERVLSQAARHGTPGRAHFGRPQGPQIDQRRPWPRRRRRRSAPCRAAAEEPDPRQRRRRARLRRRLLAAARPSRRRFGARHRRADRPLHRRPSARHRPRRGADRNLGQRRDDHARRHGRGSPPPRGPQPRARQGILTADRPSSRRKPGSRKTARGRSP